MINNKAARQALNITYHVSNTRHVACFGKSFVFRPVKIRRSRRQNKALRRLIELESLYEAVKQSELTNCEKHCIRAA